MRPLNADVKVPGYDLEPTPDHKNIPIKIVKADHQSFRQKAVFLSPHRKKFYHLVYVKQGTGRHWVDTVPYYLKQDTFYFTVPEQVHLKEEATLSGTIISFTKEYLALNNNSCLRKLPIIQNLHNGHELLLKSDEIIYVEDLLEKLVIEYQKSALWQNEMLDAYMRTLIIYLSRIYTKQYSTNKLFADRGLLNQFQEYIEENYKKLHEVADYAGLLNISTSHLNNLVKTQSGRTAITHIHERLVLEAKRLLFHTNYSIKEIAFELGFQDDSYFNRFFRRLTEQTPTVYRTTIREMYR